METLIGDPCSLLGVLGVLPGYIRGIQGLYEGEDAPWSRDHFSRPMTYAFFSSAGCWSFITLIPKP